jgi:DNA repair exonuclease SbcCD ATPase subunit
MTQTLTYTGSLVVTTCWCGIKMAIPDSLERAARKDHNQNVYCPLGHSFVYLGETEVQKLRRQLDYAQDEAARAKAERDQAEASRRAWKGQATKLRNRAVAGECPFCGEHVYQLSRHVSRKHAEEAAANPDAEPTA